VAQADGVAEKPNLWPVDGGGRELQQGETAQGWLLPGAAEEPNGPPGRTNSVGMLSHIPRLGPDFRHFAFPSRTSFDGLPDFLAFFSVSLLANAHPCDEPPTVICFRKRVVPLPYLRKVT
jgi:hypothetical protein